MRSLVLAISWTGAWRAGADGRSRAEAPLRHSASASRESMSRMRWGTTCTTSGVEGDWCGSILGLAQIGEYEACSPKGTRDDLFRSAPRFVINFAILSASCRQSSNLGLYLAGVHGFAGSPLAVGRRAWGIRREGRGG
jgi:hypothetical protein